MSKINRLSVLVVLSLLVGESSVCFAGLFDGGGGLVGNLVGAATGGAVNLDRGGAVFQALRSS